MRREGIVESISFSVLNGLELTFTGYNGVVYHVNPSNIKMGGKNCEINRFYVGCKLSFEIGVVNSLENVVIMSDGVREVNENGELVKY